MPELPVDIIRQSFDALVGLEHEWVPRKPGTALYLRPTIIATDVMLGVHPAHNYIYFLILSPVGTACTRREGWYRGSQDRRELRREPGWPA
jgi:branched-chain amino acid aminotransferase